MVELNGLFFDKAKKLRDAKKILKKLSGKKHNIYTSVYVSNNDKKIWTHTEKTTIHIRKLKDKEINFYLDKNKEEILESAGCYKAEKMGPYIFSKIDGDFYNILGFPIVQFLGFFHKKGIFKQL